MIIVGVIKCLAVVQYLIVELHVPLVQTFFILFVSYVRISLLLLFMYTIRIKMNCRETLDVQEKKVTSHFGIQVHELGFSF